MVAAAAYRSGESLTNEQDKREHDYRKRAYDVEFKRVLVPTDCTLNELKRSTLWNAAEAAEKRKDARTGREFVLALPHELNQEQRAQLAEDFARELVKRYKVAADVCLHKPAKQGDERNHHAHILITTRSVSISEDGIPILGDKIALEWSDRKRQEKGLNKAADEMKKLREKWAELANKALERAGKTERIDPRSNEAQGIEKIPEEHLGHKITALERKGVKTTVGNRNREIQKKNADLKRIEANYNNINALMKRTIKRKEQRQKEQQTPTQPTPKPSHLKFAVIWALSFVSKNANEALERLKAQFEEAKKAEEQRAKLEKEAQEMTAKVMQDLATKKQAQEAELKATDEKRKARHERGRSRRQSIENAKKRKASYQAELEKQNKQKEAQRQREEAQKSAQQAAESYCKKISNQRLQGVNVPRHQVYKGKGDEMIFRGIQHVGSQPLLLCQKENIDVVLVVPIDQQTEHRLKQINQGEKIKLDSDHSIAIKSEKTRNRGRSR
ncbi:MAG: MobA/MobL family protein [Acetobacter sp.]|nr:MobA/MobL family protein [Acetobacter sp.]